MVRVYNSSRSGVHCSYLEKGVKRVFQNILLVFSEGWKSWWGEREGEREREG